LSFPISLEKAVEKWYNCWQKGGVLSRTTGGEL